MILEKFQFDVNPPQARWNEMVTTIYNDRMWKLSFYDYSSFLEGFGKENYKFIVAIDKETNNAVGSISGTTHPSVNGSRQVFVIGMYYTVPELRSNGLGRKLFDILMSFAEGNLFLNAAPEMARKYAERSGFDKIDSWQMVSVSPNVEDCDLTKLDVDPNVKVVDFENVDFEKLVKYDRRIGGNVDRSRFLEKWLTQPDAYNKILLNDTRPVYNTHPDFVLIYNNLPIFRFGGDNGPATSIA